MKHYIMCLFMTLGLLSACNGGNSSTTHIIVVPPSPSQTIVTHINITGEATQTDQTVMPQQVLNYNATGITNNGDSLDLTNSAKLIWTHSANLESTPIPGKFIAKTPGMANISISYKNALGQRLESTRQFNILGDSNYKVNINLTGSSTHNTQSIYLNQQLIYTATATQDDGKLVDLTNSSKLLWDHSANLESTPTPGKFIAKNTGLATVTISYKNSLGQILESGRSIMIKDIPTPEPVDINYSNLQIQGDINIESAESGEVLTYKALGITADNNESDLTGVTNWKVREANAPLKQLAKGVFLVESGQGTFTIQASYTNNQVTIESSHEIKVINAKLKLASIHAYPESGIDIAALIGTKVNYKLQIQGFDNNHNTYTLNPQLTKWSVDPTIGASIDESTGYLQINSNSSGKFVITATYGGLTSNSIVVSLRRITNPITTTNDESKFTAIANDQVFYVSSESIVKSCPVATVATINKNLLLTDDLNHIASESECTSYLLAPVNSIRNRRLYYNSRYQQIYTFGDISLNNTLYSINTNTKQIKSYELPESISDISYDLNESNIYLLHTGINSTNYTTSIYKCPLTIDGPKTSACVLLKQEESTIPLNSQLVTSYLLYYNIVGTEHLYTFSVFYDTSLKINHLKILHFTPSNNSVSTAFDSGETSSPYYLYDIEMTKPSILVNQNNTYVYSVGLRPLAQLNDDLEPNTLQIKTNGNIVINYESTLNVFGNKSNYDNPDTITTYSNLAFDIQNKWVFYGTKTIQDHLSKCSYSKMGTKGEILGDCKNVTNFADTYAGLTFVPGKSLYQKTTSGMDNLFFIAKSLSTTGAFTNTLIAQCATRNDGSLISEKDCIKYKIPYITNNSTLIKNPFYKKIYVTNSTNIIYVINPDTFQIKEYTPLAQTHITKLDFSLDNKTIYILNESANGTYLHTCQVTESGAITNLCTRIQILNTPNSIRDMVNFNDKFLYLSLSYSTFKCNIASNTEVAQCSAIKLINPKDKIDYNAKKAFYKFSDIYQANTIRPFLYLIGKISNQFLIWPAIIDPSTGELALNPASPAINSDPHIMNGGDNLRLDKLSFKDTINKAYVASNSANKLLTCPYDSDIADFGTINIHSNTIACNSLADFTMYQTLNLIYMASN